MCDKKNKSKYSDELIMKAVIDYKSSDLTQKEITKKYGVPQTTFSNWLNGGNSEIKELIESHGYIVPVKKIRWVISEGVSTMEKELYTEKEEYSLKGNEELMVWI